MADDEHGEPRGRDPYEANEDDIAAEREARFAPGARALSAVTSAARPSALVTPDACPPRTAAPKQWAQQKDSIAFLIDGSASMLARAEVAPPEGSPEDTPWRAIDLALHLVQTTMRSKCVQRARGAARAAGAGVGTSACAQLSAFHVTPPNVRQRLTRGRRVVCNENDLISVTFFGTVCARGGARRVRERLTRARAKTQNLARF